MDEYIERINACLTEENHLSNAGNIMSEFTIAQIPNVLAVLLEKYEGRKNLLSEFWNSASDACPLEDTLQDDQILAFRRFVYKIDEK